MSIALRVIKKIIKYLFFLVIFGITAFLLWRIFSSGTPSSMKPLFPDEKLVSLYDEQGKGVYTFRQPQDRITTAERNRGYFSITKCIFVPEADQLHVVVRYNVSTLQKVAEQYGLDKAPERTYDVFDITLLLALGHAPEYDSGESETPVENAEYIRCRGKIVMSEEHNLYSFRYYVFDTSSVGVDLAEVLDAGTLLSAFVDFYFAYGTSVDYSEQPLGTLRVYDYVTPVNEQKLSSKDIKAIKKYTP